jgi:hypothetical protein
MRRWEKRLSNVAQLLRQCAASHFEPDRFRLNCNQFLTTSRTVNFLIQKDKALIPTCTSLSTADGPQRQMRAPTKYLPRIHLPNFFCL